MATLSSDDIILKDKIALRIRSIREQTKMSQSVFASHHLIDRQTLNRWEKGRGVTIYTVDKFCKLLNITLADFFNDSIFIE